MTIIDYAYELLQDIKEKKYSFSYALNKKTNTLNLDASDIVIVKDTLKGVVNRYYFLKSEVQDLVENKDEKETDILIISLALARFARNIVVSDVISFLSKSNEEGNYSFDIAKVEECLNKIAKNPTPIPEKYENNFVKKVALLYSYPDWIVGMMKKHFGTKNTYKSISASRKNAPINICINPMNEEEPLDSKTFMKSDIATTSYEYIGKEPLVQNSVFKARKVFVMDQIEQLIADEMEPFQGDDIFVIGGSKGQLPNLLAMKTYDFSKVYFAALSEDVYISSKKMADQFGIKSCDIFECNLEMLCTHVAYNKCDKVLVTPPNSEFGLIRQKPEILLTFKQNELDGLIEGQKKYIEEASKYVKEGGIMIYSVPTLNIKESFNIVNEFVASHEEFELLEEKLIFPYVNQTTGMYYAKLKRKSEEE